MITGRGGGGEGLRSLTPGAADGGIGLADFDQGVEAGDARHLDVEEYQIDRIVLDALEDPVRSVHHGGRVTIPCQTAGEDLTVVLVVIDNEHPPGVGIHITPLTTRSVSIFCSRRSNSTGLVS